MNKPGYYSSGQFAKMANVSVRTIRFYDKQDILKPSYVSESGARFYTDRDFARLQQILLLKYLGFSLSDIREITINDSDYDYMLSSLNLQRKLIDDRIEQMQLVKLAIDDTIKSISSDQKPDWNHMLELIHLTTIKHSIRSQYQNASNISARIRLHKDYSVNKQGWFPWLYEQCNITSGLNILELGCGNGALWTENFSHIPEDISITLSDISKGMLRDARRNIDESILAQSNMTSKDSSAKTDNRFSYKSFDCHTIPYEDNSFDLVIANHVLFYCNDISAVCSQIVRVLKPGGHFICSTYSARHMNEISKLVKDFDKTIVLSAEKLYEIFGLENGESILKPFFKNIELRRFEDEILIDSKQPLIEYILSCHGNQNKVLENRYNEFSSFIEKKTKNGFKITKDAGIFIASL